MNEVNEQLTYEIISQCKKLEIRLIHEDVIRKYMDIEDTKYILEDINNIQMADELINQLNESLQNKGCGALTIEKSGYRIFTACYKCKNGQKVELFRSSDYNDTARFIDKLSQIIITIAGYANEECFEEPVLGYFKKELATVFKVYNCVKFNRMEELYDIKIKRQNYHKKQKRRAEQ